MKLITFGEYTLKASSIEMYKVEIVKAPNHMKDTVVTLFLSNGQQIKDVVNDEGELEELTDELLEAMRGKEK